MMEVGDVVDRVRGMEKWEVECVGEEWKQSGWGKWDRSVE